MSEKVERAVALLKQGLTVKEIGEREGITRQATHFRLKRARELGIWDGTGLAVRAKYESEPRKLARSLLERSPDLTAEELGDLMGITSSAALVHIKAILSPEAFKAYVRASYEDRTGTRKIHPENLEEVRRFYWDDELSVHSIGEVFGCSGKTVLSFMKKHGIPRRQAGKESAIGPDRAEAAKQSFLKTRSVRALSEEFEVSYYSARSFLQRIGLLAGKLNGPFGKLQGKAPG